MYRVRTVSTGVAGAPFYTNIYYDADNGISPQNCADRVRLFWDAFRLIHKNLLVHQVQPDVAEVDEFSGEITGIESVSVTAVTCASTGDLLPTMTQGLVRLRTDGVVRGRRVQGRIFVPGYTEDNNVGGVPSGTGLTAAGPLLRDPGTSAYPVVWSRPVEVLGTELLGSKHRVTSFSAASTWSVLRSRRS